MNQRAKIHHKTGGDAPAVSPTLLPALPAPIPPSASLGASPEEIAFFDRVKKHVANKQAYHEFLKLCHLYTTDLLDRKVLVKRAAQFIGSSPELMNFFKSFVHTGEPDDSIIDLRPQQDSGVVNLAHCRSLGPSYRLLPKRERQKACSGRDALCFSVLNDEWASHPTWASEDSGFVAHRKNAYEDALHRIEEDRHDYDYHIEACMRSIQLMEPIVQQFLVMSDAERASFKLPIGLGGQSQAVYERIIKKLYGRDAGCKVIDDMFERPTHVLPVILFRFKQKCEEWKAAQREWDRVWREQMQRSYWRSLDHQSASVKQTDKKFLTTKQIQSEIQSKVEEHKTARKSGYRVPKHQLEFTFDDPSVIVDATHLLLTFIDRNSAGVGDTQRTMMFINDFIPVFFGLDRDTFQACMEMLANEHSPSEGGDEESVNAEEPSTPRSRKGASTRKVDLLRGVLDPRSEKASQGDKDSSAPSSRDATPDAVLVPSTPIPDPAQNFNAAELKWMEHPGQGNFNMTREYTLNEPYTKKAHHLYANLNVYCFIRSFEVLYSRLVRIKQSEADAHDDVRRGQSKRPADSLGILDKGPHDFFADCGDDANLYQQIIQMCEEVVKGDLEQPHLEETLRRFYLRSGHLLYQLEKMMAFIAKFAGSIFSGDSRDRSSDVVNLFFKERDKEETSHNQEIQYRKQVERLVKDSDIFRVTYVSDSSLCSGVCLTVSQYPTDKKTLIRIMTPEDATLDKEELSQEARWSYYVSAYTMRDPTEGVPFSRMHMPILKRNLPTKLEQEEEYNRYYRPLVHHDGLIIRISAQSYHILYEPGSYDWWWRPTVPSEESADDAAKEEAAVKERRRDRFKGKFVNNPSWVHGLSKDKVDESNQQFRSWIKGSETANVEPSAPAPASGDGDGDNKGKDNEPAAAEEPEQAKKNEEDTEMADAEPSESKEQEQGQGQGQ